MSAKVCLTVVQPDTATDSIISAQESGFPILKGNDPDHLACGACQDVLAWNLSTQTLSAMFIVVHRLLFRCRCGAFNLVASDHSSSASLVAEVALEGDDDLLRAILAEVCRITHTGFAAIARVTEDCWIACQVADGVEFGLKPGDELAIETTICNEIRQCGCAIVIDHVDADPKWRAHPVPALYGFQSYASFPIFLSDGSFYGTLCTLDPNPRALSARATVRVLENQAERIGQILSERRSADR